MQIKHIEVIAGSIATATKEISDWFAVRTHLPVLSIQVVSEEPNNVKLVAWYSVGV